MTTAKIPGKAWWNPARFRISVRTLIVLVLAIGGGLGWIVHLAQVQRRAVAAIKDAGGYVGYDWAIFGGDLDEKTNASARWKWLVDAIGVDSEEVAPTPRSAP